MKIYNSKSTDPYKNLALEEAFLKQENLKEDILYIYQNDNVVVVGRNQNAYAEIDHKFIKQNNIKLARRISGGGAVYQDMGNICFSFITKNNQKNSFTAFLGPIIEFLQSIKLDAQFKGRNDLIVNGYKISGNAQYIYKDRIVHHGTLLFDSNLSVLSNALKPNLLKLKSKAIKSARQRVTNINELLETKISSEKFIDLLINFFIDGDNKNLIIADEVKKEAQLLEKRNKS
jgi:lipoate-protein ligase A